MSLSTSCSRKLSRGREGGKRDDDGADSRGGQHADDKRDAVGVKQSDVAALAGAERDEPASQLRGATVGFGVADAFGVAHQQRVITSAAAPARRRISPTVGDSLGMVALRRGDGIGEEAPDRAQIGLA